MGLLKFRQLSLSGHCIAAEFFSHFYLFKRDLWVGHQCLMLVILATQEAEIRRITVQGQPRQIVCETLSQKEQITKKGWWSGSRCRHWAPHTQKKALHRKRKSIVILSLLGQSGQPSTLPPFSKGEEADIKDVSVLSFLFLLSSGPRIG
jgi:hypothetical protein